MSKVVVIGAGLAGLVSAIRLAQSGCGVILISEGIGGLPLSPGTVDILGYQGSKLVDHPLAALTELGPEHPYSTIGAAQVRTGVEYLARLLGPDFLVGSAERNVLLPTAVGALRPTALMQPSMVAGRARPGARWLIAGLSRLKDFGPALVAGNLNRTTLPGGGRLSARPVMIDVQPRKGEADSTGLAFARAADTPEFRKDFVTALRPHLNGEDAVGVPAVLGLKDPTAWQKIRNELGTEIFEIPLVPPSVAGLRLNDRLIAIATEVGVRMVNGVRVTGLEADGGVVTAIQTAAAGHPRTYRTDAVVYAAGGFESGALTMDSTYRLREKQFGLPLSGIKDVDELITSDFWGDPQDVFKVGVAADASMRALDLMGSPVYCNLYVVGGLLAGAHRWNEKSGEGIALGSAVAACQSIERELA
jgi:glycerol-3-phosphate dehydrogenase subunit B